MNGLDSQYDKLKQELEQLFERLRNDLLAPSDVAGIEVILDGDSTWVSDMIDRAEVHDPDYRILSKLNDLSGAILDIGANWGYSVGSMRAAGCRLPILSFEIIPQFRDCLEAVKQKLGEDYDYVMSGVGSEKSAFDLYIPVLTNRALTSLATAKKEQFHRWAIENILNYAKEHLIHVPKLIPQICIKSVGVDSIDNLIRSGSFAIPLDYIAAMKIDVEGLEGAALEGARSTITRNKPLLIIEGAARSLDVKRELLRHGYCGAIRDGDQIKVVDSLDLDGVNGIFVHPDLMEDYRRIALVAHGI